MGHKTPLYSQHLAAGAKMVEFAGWDMPLHYGSQMEEHHYVRRESGMFDVSHMTVTDVAGSGARDYLRYVLANDVERLQQTGKALYTCMLNEQGGVIDDLIVYYLRPDFYRLVTNSATREKDLAWLQQQATNFKVTITPQPNLAILAVQGPQAIAKTQAVLSSGQAEAVAALTPFQAALAEDWLIARTGYTGEDGLEIILPAEQIAALWEKLLAQGVHPCGLGARDTLRLEAGMSLYGSDMDEKITPLEANLTWTVAFDPADRQFIGRALLEAQRQRGAKWRLVGLVLEERGVLRNHQKVVLGERGEGEITSGSFSPTLGHAIALARIPAAYQGDNAWVEIRGKQVPVRIVKPPFVRKGQKTFN